LTALTCHGVRTELLVTGDGDGDAEESGVAARVGLLDLRQQIVAPSPHTLQDRHERSFL
jgi:hypothetical protein